MEKETYNTIHELSQKHERGKISTTSLFFQRESFMTPLSIALCRFLVVSITFMMIG